MLRLSIISYSIFHILHFIFIFHLHRTPQNTCLPTAAPPTPTAPSPPTPMYRDCQRETHTWCGYCQKFAKVRGIVSWHSRIDRKLPFQNVHLPHATVTTCSASTSSTRLCVCVYLYGEGERGREGGKEREKGFSRKSLSLIHTHTRTHTLCHTHSVTHTETRL